MTFHNNHTAQAAGALVLGQFGIGRRPVRVTPLSFSILLRALVDDRATLEELQEETGLGAGTVREYIKALVKARLVRVAGYLPNARGELRRIKQFEWAPDEPWVKRPPVLSSAERSRRSRERRKERERAAAIQGRIDA